MGWKRVRRLQPHLMMSHTIAFSRTPLLKKRKRDMIRRSFSFSFISWWRSISLWPSTGWREEASNGGSSFTEPTFSFFFLSWVCWPAVSCHLQMSQHLKEKKKRNMCRWKDSFSLFKEKEKANCRDQLDGFPFIFEKKRNRNSLPVDLLFHNIFSFINQLQLIEEKMEREWSHWRLAVTAQRPSGPLIARAAPKEDDRTKQTRTSRGILSFL